MPSAYDYNEDDTGPAISNDQSDADQGFAPGTNERPITPDELKAFEAKALLGAAPSGPPAPGFAGQATISGGKMYDPSGREVSSIGETPEQAAERFGATLPMGQREQQQLAQLEQGYNDLLRNPNIDPKAKHAMLADMSRQIRYGHWRMQYQLSRDRMQARQARDAGQHEVMGHTLAQQGMTSDSTWAQRKEVPGGVFMPDNHGNWKFHKTEQAKPFKFTEARKETEDEIHATQPDLATPIDPSQFDEQIPESQQNVWKAKYGKDKTDDDQRHELAAAGWAKEAEVKRKRAYEEAVRRGVHEKRMAHGQQGKSAAAPQSRAGSPAAPSGAAPSPAAQSGAAPTSGQPLFPTMEAAKVEQTRIQDWTERQHAAIKDVSDPMELKTKQEAIERAAELLGKRVTTQAPLSPAEADELTRMGQIIGNYKAAPKRSPFHFLAAGYEPK